MKTAQKACLLRNVAALEAQLQTAREALEELLSYLAGHDHGPEGKCGYCIALEDAKDALARLK